MYVYIHAFIYINMYISINIYILMNIYRNLLEALDEAADVRDPLERDPEVHLPQPRQMHCKMFCT